MITVPKLISKPTKPQVVSFALGAVSLALSIFAPQYLAGYETLVQLFGFYAMGAGTPFAQSKQPINAPS